MAIRFSLSAIVGVIVTLALFYLMQSLISGADSALTDDKIGNLVDFVRVKQDQDVQKKQRKPKNFNGNVDKTGFSMDGLNANIGIDIGSGGFGISDGEYLPIVKVQPQYPRRALSRGMSGWVIVEFTVTAQGTVTDPFVVSNCGWIKNARNEGKCEDNPNSVFDSAATKAAVKFKYKPKVIDGDPVATAGVQNKITFELGED